MPQRSKPSAVAFDLIVEDENIGWRVSPKLEAKVDPPYDSTSGLGFAGLSRLPLFGARGAQDVLEAVVSFVAFIRHHRLGRIQCQRYRERPRLRPRRRIVER